MEMFTTINRGAHNAAIAIGWAVALTGAMQIALLGGCASVEEAASTEVPEGYTSWEAYGEEQDAQQKGLEQDKMRYRMQLDRQHSGGMRR